MMIQCPRCSTRWRVAAAAPFENPLFKCGRCHHLFRQFPGAPSARAEAPAANRRAPAAPPAEADTLEFIFPDRQPAELLLTGDVTAEAPAVAAKPARVVVPELDAHAETTLSMRPPPAFRPPVIIRGLDEATAVVDATDADGDEHEADVAVAEEARGAALPELERELLADPVEDDLVLGDDDDLEEGPTAEPNTEHGRRVRVEDTMKAPAGFRTIMRTIGTAVSAFAALALMVRVAPERTTAWLARLPLAGATFAHDRNLASKVELTNVHGRFERLRNARRVFVISGDARNNSPMTIERIEVAGALYDLGGGELDQKVVTTGNRTTLTDLSEAEIVLLQRLDPAIALAPGATTPFLIVFLEPPRELREFSSRVLSVRPTRRASRPPAGSSPGSVG
jgi:predicted Zn finger-like uncharacterized protein